MTSLPPGTRNEKPRLKTAKGRSTASQKWLGRQLTDPYVKAAKAAGWRSRAAFKLLEMDERHGLLRPGLRVVDLGAAPGGWTQVAVKAVGERGRVVALDIQPMDPVSGATVLLGDFQEEAAERAVREALGGQADLVLSDMAPNLSGVAAVDQARSVHLCELALDFAVRHLKPEGQFLVKMFQGEGFMEYRKQMEAAFASVQVRKPKASRDRSAEVYVLGKGPRALQ